MKTIAIIIALIAVFAGAQTPEPNIAREAAALGANRLAADANSDHGQMLLRLALAIQPENRVALFTRELIARGLKVEPVEARATEMQLRDAMLRRAEQLIAQNAGDAENRLALLYVRACEAYGADNRAVIAALVALKARGHDDSLNALLTAPPAAPRPPHVPADAVAWGNAWYRLDSGASSWADAAKRAASLRATLATVESREALEFVLGLIGNHTAWVGAVRIGNDWFWLDGRPARDIPWAPGQPDNVYRDEYWSFVDRRGVHDSRIQGNTPTTFFITMWTPTPLPETPAGNILDRYQDGASRFHGRRYKVFEGPIIWHEARLACESMGGHLAIIPNREVNNFLHRLRGGRAYVWLGATDEHKQGDWRWLDGSPMRWTNWGKSRAGVQRPDYTNPAERYLDFFPDGTWNNVVNNHRLPFICEWPE